MTEFNRILVPLDGSSLAAQALPRQRRHRTRRLQ
jgi:hypothetical protein